MLGILDKRNAGANDKGKDTGKDLQRLNRYDLLELLVGQMREGDELRLTIANNEAKISELNALGDRLKDKLDLKDEQIEHLKDKLNLKDEQLDRLKVKLDEKDALINKLKSRLDAKDVLIARLSTGEVIAPEVLEVLEARGRAAELEATPAVEVEPSIEIEVEDVAAESESEEFGPEAETQADTVDLDDSMANSAEMAEVELEDRAADSEVEEQEADSEDDAVELVDSEVDGAEGEPEAEL